MTPDPARTDPAWKVYERDAHEYWHDLALQPPEQALLRRLGARWSELSMLDIGVGGGRTSYTFGAVAGRYVGMDFSPVMLGRARTVLREDERCSFVLADVRDLTCLKEHFDVAMFSLNGIDTLGHADRLRALGQVRAVMHPTGLLLFSSHSLHVLRSHLPVHQVPRRVSLANAYKLAKASVPTLRLAMIKRKFDFDAAERAGWARVRDSAHGFDMEIYYVSIAEQQRQLEATGWELLEVWGLDGRLVDPDRPGRDLSLHYLCRPSTKAP
ncbi:MAG: class I SAM-dependent methyltransferase [Acidimicrobiales bacterium]